MVRSVDVISDDVGSLGTTFPDVDGWTHLVHALTSLCSQWSGSERSGFMRKVTQTHPAQETVCSPGGPQKQYIIVERSAQMFGFTRM